MKVDWGSNPTINSCGVVPGGAIPRGGAGGREGGAPEEGGGGDGGERARAELKRDRSFGGGPRAALRAGWRLAGAGADPSGT